MQQQRPTFALVLRLASALVFSVMFLLVKLAAESGVKVPEILFWRQVLTFPAIAIWLLAHGQMHRLKTKRLGAHAMRAVVGTSNMAIVFTATALLPLAETTTLGFTTPLFAVVIAATVLRQYIGPWRWTAVLLGFVGVLVIAQPGGHHVDPLGASLALFGALLVAVINFQIRDLGRSEESICIVGWFGVFGSAIAALAMPFAYTPHDGTQWAMLIGLGILGLVGQLLMTASLRYGSVASVIVMDYTALIWAAALGWMAWGHLPSFATWLGAPLVVGSGLVIAWRERRLGGAEPVKGDTR